MKHIWIVSLIVFFVGCGTKPIRATYQQNSSHAVIGEFVKKDQNPIAVTKRKSTHTIIAPKDAYSIGEYAIYKYEQDCDELHFRKEILYRDDLKYNPLSVAGALADIEANIKKYSCQGMTYP